MAKSRAKSRPATGTKTEPETGSTARPAEATQNVDQAQLIAAAIAANQRKPGLLVSYGPFLLAIGLAAFFWFQYGRGTNKPDESDDKIDVESRLVDQVRKTFPKSADALVFSSACSTLAKVILADGETSKPALTKRSQAIEQLPAEFARAIKLAVPRDIDVALLGDLVASQFDEESEVPQTEGALTEADRRKVAKQFQALSDAASVAAR